MIIQQPKQSSDSSSGNSFKIDNGPFMFDVLRNKIYSDKIGAVCRQVLSNSIDANRQNKVQKPAQVTLPTMYHKFIQFKDNGIGISPDRMDLFTVYGQSTKRNDANQIGGFGCGSKTPFSYADQFFIQTTSFDKTKNSNVKRKYRAFIDQSKKGKMSDALQQVVTKQETGTVIKVPVKDINFDQFKSHIIKLAKYAKIKPDVYQYSSVGTKTLINIQPIIYNLSGKDWGIQLNPDYNSYGNRSKLVINISGVPYDYDFNNLIDNQTLNMRKKMQDHVVTFYSRSCSNIVVNYNSGQIPVSISRQQIQIINQDLGVKLVNHLKSVHSQCKQSFIVSIQNASNLIQAKTLYAKACIDGIFSQGTDAVKWKNITVKDNFIDFNQVLSQPKFSNFSVSLYSYNTRRSKFVRNDQRKIFFGQGNVVFLTKTLTKPTVKASIPVYAQAWRKADNSIKTICLVTCQAKTPLQDVADFYKQADEKIHYNSYDPKDLFSITLPDQLIPVKKTRKTYSGFYTITSRMTRNKIQTNSDLLQQKCYYILAGQKDEKGKYYFSSNTAIQVTSSSLYPIQNYCSSSNIVTIPKATQEDDIPEQWVPLQSLIKKQIQNLINNDNQFIRSVDYCFISQNGIPNFDGVDKLISIIKSKSTAYNKVRNVKSFNMLHNSIQFFRQIVSHISHEIRIKFNKYSELRTIQILLDKENQKKYPDIIKQSKQITRKKQAIIQSAIRKYPLMKRIQVRYGIDANSQIPQEVADYIVMIQKK